MFETPGHQLIILNSSVKLKQFQVILGAVTEMIMNILAVHTRDLLRFNHCTRHIGEQPLLAASDQCIVVTLIPQTPRIPLFV